MGENNIQRVIPVARKLVSLAHDPQVKHRLAHNNLNPLPEKMASVENVLVHKLPPPEPAFIEQVKPAAFEGHIRMLSGEPIWEICIIAMGMGGIVRQALFTRHISKAQLMQRG